MKPNDKKGPLLTVRQMAEHPRYPWLTERALRHYIHDAKARISSKGEEIGGNGLAAAMVRIGRRVLVDTEAFDAWVNGHRESD